MARRRRTLTREDLLHRYATVRGLTYGEAHDAHSATGIEELRGLVESLEEQRHQPFDVLRASWAEQQRTTTVRGVTR